MKVIKEINIIDYINDINNSFMDDTEMSRNPVSELHMHKILFIEYGMFYKKYKKEIFKPNFLAWKYGPVEIDYRNNLNDEEKIAKLFTVKLNEDEIKFLNELTNKLIKWSPWYLVDLTHTFDCWINNYDVNDPHSSKKISSKEIQSEFKFFNI